MSDTQGKARIECDLSFYYKVSDTEGKASTECDLSLITTQINV